MRTRAEILHSQVNEKFIGTFHGIEEQRQVYVNDAGMMKNDQKRMN